MTLIAHYKFNENTSGDNAELVVGGNFTSWTGDNPIGWTIVDEVASDPMVNEVGAGQGQGGLGTGYCNIYSSTSAHAYIQQNITLVVGRKYKFTINVDTLTVNELRILDNSGNSQFTGINYNSTGTKTFTFVAVHTDLTLLLRRANSSACDLTFDDVSIKLCAVEDSSGNDHDGLAQQDTDAISAANTRGVGTCFDFNGSSDFIDLPDDDDFNFSMQNQAFSISVWFQTTTYGTIVSKAAETNRQYQLFVETIGQLYAVLGGEATIWNTADLRDNIWHHVVLTVPASTTGAKCYIDGIEQTSFVSGTGAIGSIMNVGQSVNIGARTDGSYLFDGLIDNVMFFNQELNEDQTKALYHGGHGTEIVEVIDLDRRIQRRQ